MHSRHEVRSTVRVAAAALGLTCALGFAPSAGAQTAESAPAPTPEARVTERPRQRIRLEDSDPRARFELRDERGALFRCVGSCELTAPEGRYHVLVTHGRSVDETDVMLSQPMTVRARKSSWVGVGLGVPMIVGGALAGLIGALVVTKAGDCLDCTDAEVQRAQASAPGNRRGGYLVIGAGVLAVAGGIYLITTSHGSSVSAEASEARASAKSFAVALVPNLGGASLSVAGSF
jgi:hypothetical protein